MKFLRSAAHWIARACDTAPFWLAVWAALIAVRLLGLAARYTNHDVAWYLYMARVLLGGGYLYRDVVDPNPPLIVWVSAPAAWVAQTLGVSDGLAFGAYVVLLTAASLVASAALLRRVWPAFPAHIHRALVTLVLYLLFVRIHMEFGQREHLAMVLSLPYVLAAMAWAAGRPLRGAAAAAAGVAAGVGLALKPHLLAPAVLVEAYLAWRQPSQRSWRRPEVLAIAVVVLAYGAAVAVWTPEYFAVAELVARLYGGLNPPALTLLRVPEVPLWGFAALLLVLTRLPVDSRPAWTVLFLAATGFLVAALAQMKGWEYHLYPAEVTLLFLVVAAIFWVLDALGSLPAVIAGGTRSIVVLLAAALLVSTGRQTMRDRQPDSRDLVTPLHAIVEQYAHGGPIYVMGMLVYPAFPLVNVSGLEWSSRHNSLWFLQGLYREELARPGEFRFRTPAEMPALEGEFYEEIITDLCSRPPAVLIVESLTHYGPGGRRPFDVLAYYRQDSRFEHLFSAYRPVGQVDAFRAYVSSGDASCTLDESRLVRERGLDHRQRISSPAASPTAAVADTTVRFGYASSTS